VEPRIVDLFSQILGTIALRPYFVAFLLAYFLACSLRLGFKQALLFAAVGFAMAWASEYSSIHTGIPFGRYHYLWQTKGRELWVLGVPFMDSMSFVFLSYASYSVALFALAPRIRAGVGRSQKRRVEHSLRVRLLGALLCMYLDVIIDPVALKGSKWFLGQIYGYDVDGVYFGIPLSNFAGWFIVSFFLIYALQLIDRLAGGQGRKETFRLKDKRRYLLGPALYLAIVIFNLSVTLAIREYNLFWAGIMIALMPLVLFVLLVKEKLAGGDAPDQAVSGLLGDSRGTLAPGKEGL
jgi:uncharacterized membrane protein